MYGMCEKRKLWGQEMSFKQENIKETVDVKFKEMDPTQRLKISIMDVLGVDNSKINREILTSGITPLEEIKIKKQLQANQIRNENKIPTDMKMNKSLL